ncbi:MAG: methyltransferase [Gemmatimonadaceae bacterium]
MAVPVGGQSYSVATKPGVLAHGFRDPAAMLLAEQVVVPPDGVVVLMNCGNGLTGAVIAGGGRTSRLLLTDRNLLSVDAARRTMARAGVEATAVYRGQGAHPLPRELQADVVAIRIPLEKLALHQLLWDAHRILRVGGRCYIAGATNEGIKSAAKAMERLFGEANLETVSSGHRVLSAARAPDIGGSVEEFENPFLDSDHFNELHVTLRGSACTLFTRPGVFSWDHADEATEILAGVMEVQRGDAVLDLGCGAGGLGLVAARLSGTGRVSMVDADVEAVRSATRTVQHAGLDQCTVLASDVASAVLAERFDVVVTNPPFHVGKSTDLRVPVQFIHDAWEVLRPGGRLFLVANRTLPYEREVNERFGNLATAHDGRRFKVLSAVRR